MTLGISSPGRWLRPYRFCVPALGVGHDLLTLSVQYIPSLPRGNTILGAFEQARTELIGKAVILTDGKAGTVENVWLDEFHGLRISIKCHDGRWPVSTIKFTQS